MILYHSLIDQCLPSLAGFDKHTQIEDSINRMDDQHISAASTDNNQGMIYSY